MAKGLKIFLFILVAGIATALLTYKYVYNKAHVDYQNIDAAFLGAAADFYQQAIADEEAFISNYRNKAVSINGEIIEITGSGIQMAPGILLSTLENSGAVALGDVITCKGRMVGIEEDLLTGDLLIRLDECSCD
jgi:hypothetical protein